MADWTLLVFAEIGIPLYSARDIRQTLEPIPAATHLRRTVNGTLKDVSSSAYRRYRSTITCTDRSQPALDGVWPGQLLTVDCASELTYRTSTGGPEKTAVPGSEREDGDFSFYRPRLTMRVVSFSTDFEERMAEVAWQLELEEV